MADGSSWERWLEGRKARLTSGPTAEDFALPDGVSMIEWSSGVRFRGDAQQLLALADELRKLERSTDGDSVRVLDWTFVVDDEPAALSIDKTISMPWHAWGIAASKFGEVATSFEDSPFDFSECGYIVRIDSEGVTSPAPRPDLGVELVGDPIPR